MTPRIPQPPASEGVGGATLRADAQRNRARILAAAEEVFATRGTSASTEEVARRAGVAIGTVFRHFPTKQDLLQAIMKDLLRCLTSELNSLAAEGDPATALFTFFSRTVAQAAAKKSVVELLGDAGIEVQVAGPVQSFRHGLETLLTQAQRRGAIRDDVQSAEVMALLTSACQGALHGGWDENLQRRVLTVIFGGLRASA